MNAQEVWAEALQSLKLRLPRSDFETWLQGTAIVAFEEGLVVIATPNAFARHWLEKTALEDIRQVLYNILGYNVQVRIIVASAGNKARSPSSEDPARQPQPEREPPGHKPQPALLRKRKEDRHIIFRKGEFIDYPYELCFNSYEHYVSRRYLEEPLIWFEDIAAHLWFCYRYHQDYPWHSEYLYTDIAEVLYGDAAKKWTVKRMIQRLEAADLITVTRQKGRGKRFAIRPHMPLARRDFLIAVDQGHFAEASLKPSVRVPMLTAASGDFDATALKSLYAVSKPHNFQREQVSGRGFEPCLHSMFQFYLGDIVRLQEESGEFYLSLPGPSQHAPRLIPWNGAPPSKDRAIVRLTQKPLLDLTAISLALLLRKRANKQELKKTPWVEVSIRRMSRHVKRRWTTINEALDRLERAGIVREIGSRRAESQPNTAPRFELWDPCETLEAFLDEVLAGEIDAELSEFGLYVARHLDYAL